MPVAQLLLSAASVHLFFSGTLIFLHHSCTGYFKQWM